MSNNKEYTNNIFGNLGNFVTLKTMDTLNQNFLEKGKYHNLLSWDSNHVIMADSENKFKLLDTIGAKLDLETDYILCLQEKQEEYIPTKQERVKMTGTEKEKYLKKFYDSFVNEAKNKNKNIACN